jgi:hypothetical protein
MENYRRHYLRVFNDGEADFVDMFDGIPITIEKGRSQNLPLDMAAHLFGYHEGSTADSMFKYTAKRQGWNMKDHLVRQESGKTLAEELFGKFRFEPVNYKLVEEKPDLSAPILADPQVPVEEDVQPLPPRRRASAA